jgi:integrase
MASITQKKGTRYWFACYTDNKGKRKQRSTKETDRRKAQSVANELESAYRKELTGRQLRKLYSEALENIHGDSILSTPTTEYFTQWLKRKKVETTPGTWKNYQGIVNRFLDANKDIADKDLSLITANDLINHRDNLAETLTITTTNNHLRVLRVALQDGLRSERIDSNPASLVPPIKRKGGTANKRRAFTMPEINKLLEVANDEWIGIILTAFYTGQRLGDIVRLTWNNVDLHRPSISLTTKKTDRFIDMTIHRTLLGHFLTIPAPDNSDTPVFPDAYALVQKHSGHVSALSTQFHSIMVSAGLVSPRSSTGKREGTDEKRRLNTLSFHCLRHTAESSLKNAGVSDAVAMDIIGHSSKAISQIYTHIDDDAKRTALNSLPDIYES